MPDHARDAIFGDVTFGLALNVAVGLWLTMEIVLQVRERSWMRLTARQDRGTAAWLAVGIAAGVGIGLVLREPLDGSRGRVFLAVAAALVLVGALFRLWAVIVLGRQFRVVLGANESATLVTRGPYAVIRHPSYAGLIISLTGIGVADGGVWSAVALALIPLPAVVHRIHVEEASMVTALGAPYEEYRSRTWKLMPRLW